MQFDFDIYIEKLRNGFENEVINTYENFYGKVPLGIKNQVWYTDYVSKFIPYYQAIEHPKGLTEDFDWELLFALCVSSFSSKFEIVKSNTIFLDKSFKSTFKIIATETLVKQLDELYAFQIERLFEIYVAEQIKLQSLIAEGGQREMIDIYEERIKTLNYISNYDENFVLIKSGMVFKDDKILYHYTSFSTINEVLKTNSLRACDLKRLNDKNEHKIWFMVFEEAVASITSFNDSDRVLDILEFIKKRIDEYKKLDCFVTCFSKERDLLSQWRAYGDDGEGICIGFDSVELLNLLYQNNTTSQNFSLLNGSLDYDYHRVCYDVRRKILDICKLYLESDMRFEEFSNQVDKLNTLNDICEQIFFRIQDLKDSSFFEEKEFRLFWQQDTKGQGKKVNTFEKNKRIIPFVELDFGNNKIPIKEIIVGPAVHEKQETIEGIKKVLEHYGLDVNSINIVASKIPYRK